MGKDKLRIGLFLILWIIIITGCNQTVQETVETTYTYPGITTYENGTSNYEMDSVSMLIKNLVIPWELIWGKDNRIWATVQVPARVIRLNPNTQDIKTLEIIDEDIAANFFVMGMALHPDWPAEPTIYLSFIQFLPDMPGTTKMHCKKYTVDTLAGTISKPQLIIGDIFTEGSANAGGCLFVSQDKHLFVKASFESEASNASRKMETLLGKWLRYNLDGSIPNDNPFTGSPIYTLGHRNAQGMVETPDGKLFTCEHGPTTDDEVNLIEKGKDYGWPDVHGFCDKPEESKICKENPIAEPLISWTPTIAPSSIDYYGYDKYPQLKNCLLVTTLKNSEIRVLKLDNQREKIVSDAVIFKNQLGRLRNICFSPDGRIFISTANNFPVKGGTDLKLPPINPEIPFDVIAEVFVHEKPDTLNSQ